MLFNGYYKRSILEDVPQMLEIYNDVILNTTAVYNYDPHTLAMRTEWFGPSSSKASRYL